MERPSYLPIMTSLSVFIFSALQSGFVRFFSWKLRSIGNVASDWCQVLLIQQCII
ncbi:hypothetical protein Peur_010460 [Populus x canadensis]